MRPKNICEHLKDDKKGEGIFDRDNKPIGVEIYATAMRICVKKYGKDNCAENVENDVGEECREAFVYPVLQDEKNEKRFEREAPEPGDEFVGLHRPLDTILLKSGLLNLSPIPRNGSSLLAESPVVVQFENYSIPLSWLAKMVTIISSSVFLSKL
jgi:hypothetical protein